MKKIIIGMAVAASLASCKKISEGGNEGRLKLDETATRYSDDKQGAVIVRDTASATAKKADSSAVKVAPAAASAKKETSATTMSAPVGNAQSTPK